MPINVTKTYKLNTKSRKALVKYLKGDIGIQNTAEALNTTRQRVYTMAASIFRHGVSTGKLDIEAVIKDY